MYTDVARIYVRLRAGRRRDTASAAASTAAATALTTFFAALWGVYLLLRGVELRLGIEFEWGDQSEERPSTARVTTPRGAQGRFD